MAALPSRPLVPFGPKPHNSRPHGQLSPEKGPSLNSRFPFAGEAKKSKMCFTLHLSDRTGPVKTRLRQAVPQWSVYVLETPSWDKLLQNIGFPETPSTCPDTIVSKRKTMPRQIADAQLRQFFGKPRSTLFRLCRQCPKTGRTIRNPAPAPWSPRQNGAESCRPDSLPEASQIRS